LALLGVGFGGGGRLAAEPVVTPDAVLAWGVTSRMPGGAGGGCVLFCAVEATGAVLASWTEELFKP
jgi:hypothetical protein